MKITDDTGKERSQASILKQYFGLQPNQTISQFNDELKQLSPEAKEELAIGAAKNLGYNIQT